MSSLSDERVISLASRYFVPAWISRDRYQQGKIERDELLLLGRIDKSRKEKKLEGGAVCVYVVRPDGEAVATLTVHKAWKPDLLAAFLKKIIADESLKERSDEQIKAVAPAKAEATAKSDDDARLFHVRTRFDGKENRGTGRDTVELSKAEWSAFVAKKGAAVGDSWKVPRAVAEKLLRNAYPPLSSWNAKLAKLSSCSLTATVTSVSDGRVKVRLIGRLELIYPHKGEPTDGTVTADLVGYARCDEAGALTALAIASDEATYVSYWKDKAIRRTMTVTVEPAD